MYHIFQFHLSSLNHISQFIGVFSFVRFSRGDKIGRIKSRRVKEDGPYIIHYNYSDGREFRYEPLNEFRFLNHSNKPNAEVVGMDVFALKVINPNDEITFYYSDDAEEFFKENN